MYHRIADLACDPWELAVSPGNFEQQLQVLQHLNAVISLPALAEQLKQGNLKTKSIVLTFDDGYVDNFTAARPLLEKYGIPASFFIPTESVSLNREFWWDELERILIHTEILPPTLEIELPGEQLSFDLQEEAHLSEPIQEKHKSWRYYETGPTIRSKIYMALWLKLIKATAAEQQQVLNKLRNWAQISIATRVGHNCISETQLKQLNAHPLFTIGAHTVTHTALGFQPPTIQRLEIKGSKEYLENLTGTQPHFFSYPNGSHNQSARNILKEEGFSLALTTDHHLITKNTDQYQLARFQVNNWSATKFEQHLNNWMRGFS